MKKSRIFFPVLLVLLWLIMIVIINPTGNFPLNDDWQYSRPVWYLINKGYYFSPDQYSPIIALQVLWGTLFCLPFGFSFTALRLSTLILSLVGVLAFYFFVLKISNNKKISFLCSLILASNPFYISMSCSFMTDVPFLFFSILAVYFYFNSIDSGKPVHIILGTLFAISATLIRQYGLIIPVAYAIASLIYKKPRFLEWWKYILPAILTMASLKLTLWWLKHIGSELRPYEGAQVIDFFKKPSDIFSNAFERGRLILMYTGFFLLPLLTFTTWQPLAKSSRRGKILVIGFVLLFIPVLITGLHRLPWGNIVHTYGIGAETLKGLDTRANPNPGFPPALLGILKTMAFFGGLLLLINISVMVANIIKAYSANSLSKTLIKQLMILTILLGYAILLFIPHFFFDRYTLPFIPLTAIAIIVGSDLKINPGTFQFLSYNSILVAIGLFSCVQVRNYMQWNEARWTATDYLTKELKISPHKIDGGYEFNGWNIGTYFPINPKNPTRSNWFVDDDEYIVTYRSFNGYSIIKLYSYQNYLPYEKRNIFVLHRN